MSRQPQLQNLKRSPARERWASLPDAPAHLAPSHLLDSIACPDYPAEHPLA